MRLNSTNVEESRFYDESYLARDLPYAVPKNELTLFYQPQIGSKENKIMGFEALIRWNHPEKGLLLPSRFIPYAEFSGLIVDIGKWVIEAACHQVKEWQDQFDFPYKIAVNLSIRQFMHSNLIEIITQALDSSGLRPSDLEIELTESVTVNTELISSTLKELKNMGIRISIDDFGKGYSSLYYVKELPVDKIKIDRSFIVDMHVPKDRTIVNSIISLANRLGLEIVAEGIETKEQMNMFQRHCHFLQGFYISEPLPVTEVECLLKTV